MGLGQRLRGKSVSVNFRLHCEVEKFGGARLLIPRCGTSTLASPRRQTFLPFAEKHDACDQNLVSTFSPDFCFGEKNGPASSRKALKPDHPECPANCDYRLLHRLIISRLERGEEVVLVEREVLRKGDGHDSLLKINLAIRRCRAVPAELSE